MANGIADTLTSAIQRAEHAFVSTSTLTPIGSPDVTVTPAEETAIEANQCIRA